MMLTNNVSGALNAYFTSKAAGNCGYNLPYAGVAIAHGCASVGEHTWAHEIGHALSLPHPFIGWEGKTYNPNNPTPDTLTYDYTYFHDTLDTQIPAPLDTALVEYVDGSNCTIAADLICDTKPDYLSYRWNCDGEKKSLVKQTDPAGEAFYSDGTLFMSYSADECQNRFSADQIAIMRATLLAEKADWLTNSPVAPDVSAPPILTGPVNGQMAPAEGALLQWSPVAGATHYLLQASRFGSYIVKDVEIITTDTSYLSGQLFPDKTYYWRVRPFNYWYTCTQFSGSATFKTLTVRTVEADSEGWRCYPSLLAPAQPLTIEWPPAWQNRNGYCFVYNVSGQIVWQSHINTPALQTTLRMPSDNWPAGIYRLVAVSEKGIKSQSLVLTE
jgi:hypothetical protein